MDDTTRKTELARRVAEWCDRRRPTASPALRQAIDDYPDVVDQWGFGHPAALGCLLALVREAWGDEVGQIAGAKFDQRPDGSPCFDVWYCDRLIGSGDTEAEALVAALEAAP